jgi:hypothetical protein
LAAGENFVVFARDQATAEAVRTAANRHRSQIARDWLSRPIPDGIGRATINVRIDDSKDEGFTWPIDDPRRSFHKVWLTTSQERALGTTLKHEIAHTVLATRYPDLPEWAEEGVASTYDDADRQQLCRQKLAWYHETGQWPSLEQLLSREVITATDTASYAVSASLVRYLLTRGDRAILLTFAATAKGDWDAALRRHYGVQSVGDLQREWQAWEATRCTNPARRNVVGGGARSGDKHRER